MIPFLLLAVVLTAVLGLAVGSFTNVVVYRVPAGLSVVHPRSACPRCSTPIAARDNVPVLSWLLLRAKCRTCALPISARYPLVELAVGVFWVAVTTWMVMAQPPLAEPGPAAAFMLQLTALLYVATISIALALIDIDTKTLPDRIVWPSYAVVGVLLAAAGVLNGDLEAVARAAAGAGILVGAYFILLMVSGGMGLGDVKLAGVLGLVLGWFGWQQLIVGAGAAFLLGGVFSIVLIALGRVKRKQGIPFGPWMIAGAWIGIFAGVPIADTYLSLVGLR
ncbi:prepilin peptidase [Schumannella soli]|uniref:prepilin peptidase n=1 Tax=Schumannella soli TaxID=2590779 RepID=UPI0021059204|nr:A24 family peptidase [Schumannella soli]